MIDSEPQLPQMCITLRTLNEHWQQNRHTNVVDFFFFFLALHSIIFVRYDLKFKFPFHVWKNFFLSGSFIIRLVEYVRSELDIWISNFE